jgi:hypothetical protein
MFKLSFKFEGNIKANMFTIRLVCGPSGRVPAQQVQGPEFKLQNYKKRKKINFLMLKN